MIKNKQGLFTDVNKYANIFDEIATIKDRVFKFDENAMKQFNKMQKRIHELQDKLSNPKFEVAIIGTEKAGKSTFANALLNNNYLPEAIGRCTFTTTVIESDKNKNQAIINFFTKEEFVDKFNKLCDEVEIKEFSYHDASMVSFKRLLEDKTSAIKTSNAVDDIIAIINSKSELEKNLGRKEEIIVNNIKDNVKQYIVEESLARAVKNITIVSNELKEMDDLVIYDVPGFDSPTNLHLEQAKKYMVKADVVVMLTSIADRVSFVKAQTDFLNDTRDEYGTSLADKLIMVASKFDKHLEETQKESEDRIEEFNNVLISELIKYDLYKKQNLFRCSSLGYLEKNKIIPPSKISKQLNELQISDGIEAIKARIEDFYKTEALQILNDVVRKDLNQFENFLIDFKTKHNQERNREKNEDKLNVLKTETKKDFEKKLMRVVSKYKKIINDNDDFGIRVSLKNDLSDKWINKLIITDEMRDEETEKLINTDSTIDRHSAYSTIAREKTYKNALNGINSLVTDIIIEKNSELIGNFKKEIFEVFGVSKNSDLAFKLEEKVFKELIDKKAFEKRDYIPLIRRFVNDIFTLLLHNPLSKNEQSERVKGFKKLEYEIYSLLPFEKDNFENELELDIYEKTLVKKILVQHEDFSLQTIADELSRYKQYFSENIDLELLSQELFNKVSSIRALKNSIGQAKDALKDLTKDAIVATIISTKSKNTLKALLDDVEEATSYVAVQEEINRDLKILEDIFSRVLIPAMMIEKPFIDSLKDQIESIRIDLSEKYDSRISTFISNNIKELKRIEYCDIEGDEDLNKKINSIVDNIKKLSVNA